MRRVKAYPRYHSNYGHQPSPSDSSKSYPCNGGTREHLAFRSILRLGSDGSDGFPLPAYTNRWLSANRNCRTVFVTAFEILTTLYHVFPKKSNVFIIKIFLFFCTAFIQFYKGKNTVFQELTNRQVCGLMTSVHITKTLTENLLLHGGYREPAVGVSRCGQRKQSDSWVGSVNEMFLQ